MKFQKKGFIDLGSNSIRFVIYKMTKKGTIKEELNVKRTARLSLHVDEDKNITAKGIDKIIKSFQFFKKMATFHQVNDIQCFATAVMREAPNQTYVIKKVRKAMNINIAVLSELEEAYYGFIGAVDTTAISDGVTIDIGGGSTEVTLFENKKLKHAHSFPFGAVTLTKKFVSGKKPTKKEMAQLASYLSEQFSELSWLKAAGFPVIGIGGTARNLRQVCERNELSTSGQQKMNEKDVRLTSEYLRSFSLRKRKKVAGLSKERADIIIPGIEAIFQLMDIVQAPSFEASKQGLREGICYSELFEESIRAR